MYNKIVRMFFYKYLAFLNKQSSRKKKKKTGGENRADRYLKCNHETWKIRI